MLMCILHIVFAIRTLACHP